MLLGCGLPWLDQALRYNLHVLLSSPGAALVIAVQERRASCERLSLLLLWCVPDSCTAHGLCLKVSTLWSFMLVW